MLLILTIISILITILILIIIFPIKIIFDSDKNFNFNVLITWINPLFKAIIQNKNTNIFLSVYLFNKKIFTKPIKAKVKKANKSNKSNKRYYLRQIKPYCINIYTSYGFKDPSTTGIICGIINSFSEIIGYKNMYNNPNFTSDDNYFNIKGIAKFHIAPTIIRLLPS